jgi:hypothetical protein
MGNNLDNLLHFRRLYATGLENGTLRDEDNNRFERVKECLNEEYTIRRSNNFLPRYGGKRKSKSRKQTKLRKQKKSKKSRK